MLSLLTFSTLFPNAARPNHGVFVENRLRHLVATGDARSTVLAPVPWFPSRNTRFGDWARHAAAPAFEQRHGLDVYHPRYAAIPAVGMRMAPALLYASAARALRRLLDAGARFDAIDAHYFYPDGVAAVWMGKRFGLPVVVTARGSDVTQFPDYAAPRRMILEAARHADAVVTVSEGLRQALIRLGVPPAHLTVLRNGIDLAAFRPVARAASRASFGVTGPTLVSVGGLIPRKGHRHTIEALRHLPEWTLLIAGEGPERDALQAHASALGLAGRVRLLGPLPHASLPELYSAADMSVLSSSREGWANVLLESMACGTPVIASPIPGNDEVVQRRAAGLIAADISGESIAASVRDLASDPPGRDATRHYAEAFSWDETSAGQLRIFRSVLAGRVMPAGVEPSIPAR